MKKVNLNKEEVIEKYKELKTLQDTALYFDVSIPTIIRLFKEHNFLYDKNKNYKYYNFSREEINNIIHLYEVENNSTLDIGKIFNCSKHIIRKNLLANNIKIKNRYHRHQQYNIDENVFENINTHDKSYWLGILTGDGCITDRNDIHLSLQEKDKHIIYAFRDFLKSNHPIKKISNGIKKDGEESISYYISICNKKINDDLRKYGFTRNKTKEMKFPKISDEFLSSYLLGLTDSDGSIYLKNNDKRLCYSFIGTKEFVEEFQNILVNKCNIKRTKLDTHHSTDYIRIVCYSAVEDVYKIIKFLYLNQTSIWFERKKNIGINYLLNKYPKDEWLLNQKNILPTYLTKFYVGEDVSNDE